MNCALYPMYSVKWVGRDGHLACGTWWLLSRNWGRRAERFMRLAPKDGIETQTVIVEFTTLSHALYLQKQKMKVQSP